MEDHGICHDVMAYTMACRMIMEYPMGSPMVYPIYELLISRKRTFEMAQDTCHGASHGTHRRVPMGRPMGCPMILTMRCTSHILCYGVPHGWFRTMECFMVHMPWGQPWDIPQHIPRSVRWVTTSYTGTMEAKILWVDPMEKVSILASPGAMGKPMAYSMVRHGLDHEARGCHGMYHGSHHRPMDCAMVHSMGHGFSTGCTMVHTMVNHAWSGLVCSMVFCKICITSCGTEQDVSRDSQPFSTISTYVNQGLQPVMDVCIRMCAVVDCLT